MSLIRYLPVLIHTVLDKPCFQRMLFQSFLSLCIMPYAGIMEWHLSLFILLWFELHNRVEHCNMQTADGLSRVWRYTRLLVHLAASWTFKPIMPAVRPKFSAKDVTIVLPTRDGRGEAFRRCVETMLHNNPEKLIVVTPLPNVRRLQKEFRMFDCVTVLGTPPANKRLQMAEGLARVDTPITVFADDDVLWPEHYLHYFLAAFEDDGCGAAGTCQRLLRAEKPNFWHFLGAAYLQRRNFEFTATMNIDSGTSALSGRTQAHRISIIKNNEFLVPFLSETWMGILPLGTADDDNFITRYMVNKGWKIRIQSCKEAEIQTMFSDDSSFLKQCVRWFRTTWRSNLTSMFVDKTIWKLVLAPVFLPRLY